MKKNDLICLICGNEEGPPFDIGDECTCGGLFVLKEGRLPDMSGRFAMRFLKAQSLIPAMEKALEKVK